MRTTPIAVALVLVLAACGGGDVAPLVMRDADGMRDGGADATTPADAGDRDAGELLVDAGAVEVDAGELLDAGAHDSGSDARRGYEGECSLVPQSGCEAGEACRLVGGESVCGAVRVDPAGEYERCDDGAAGAECEAGFSCQSSDCVRLCTPGSACPDFAAPRGTLVLECRPTATPTIGLCVPR